ncbi:MAG: PQQ-binding-like beta-propeller repeat protein, partial [Planctomycetes bacterium]|nr:PQQ-binding-like beta-propeller repeat protein [Planctomycetota bacterium]
AFLSTSSLTLSLTRDRPNDRAKAETLAALLVLHILRKERIHVLQVASVLSDFDASLSLTVDGKGTTLGSFLKELGLDSLSFTQENAPVAMPSKFDAEALWKESFTISTEVDARYLEILQIVPRSDNESDVTFLNVSKGIPELVAIETESGKELWRISNGVVYAGVVRVGENFVLHDGQSIIAVNRTSGIKQWDIEGAGAMLDFEHYAGLGVVTYYERYAGRTYVGAQIIDLTKGSEIWKLRFGQTSQSTLGVRGRWLYVVDVTSPAEAHVKRLNLLTGEEELRQPFPYHIDGSSTMQFAGDTEIVLHGRDPRSKRVLVMTINTATLDSKPLLGPLSSVPDIAVSGDRIAVVSSDGLGAIYSLKERKALHSLTEQVENATVRSVQIKGDRVIVEWRPQAQTYSVWFTCYSLSSGKKLMHQEVWKASEGVQVANFDSHLSHYDKGIVVTIAHTIRVERRVGRVIQYAFESQPLEVLVIDIEKLTTHKQPLFEGARQMSYMIPLEFLALATEKGLLMSDGVNQVALFGAKR